MFLRNYSVVKQLHKTDILQNYSEVFKSTKTRIKEYDGKKYIEAELSDVNFKYEQDGSFNKLPVHFYSDLPIRLEDLWSSMQKRNMRTFINYVKSFGTNNNPVMLLTKVSNKGNRYFTFTTKAKFQHYRNNMYSNYNIEELNYEV
jgi:hypothetical protein